MLLHYCTTIRDVYTLYSLQLRGDDKKGVAHKLHVHTNLCKLRSLIRKFM